MRIVSLLPSTTEIVFALGLGDALVGVTHECDYPPEAADKPVVTASTIDHEGASAMEIDAAVSAQLHAGLNLYRLDEPLLQALRPDLILTQELCAVCAVSADEVRRVVRGLATATRVLAVEPTSLDDILASILLLGQATGREERALELVAGLRVRVERVREQAREARRRPRVALLEWIDPPYGAGHWVPELIALAGGSAGLGALGVPARRISWGEVIGFAPEVIVVACCGMGIAATLAEARELLPARTGWEALPAVRAGRVYITDGSSYFSRPGPRIVESLELLAELVHPDLFAGSAPQRSYVPFYAGAARQAGAPLEHDNRQRR
jgi:iron complex transport system substrate-binding protein